MTRSTGVVVPACSLLDPGRDRGRRWACMRSRSTYCWRTSAVQSANGVAGFGGGGGGGRGARPAGDVGEEVELLERAAEDRGGVAVEPVVEEGGVDGPEVDRRDEVAALVERGQRRAARRAGPPRTFSPTTNITLAVPWSVPSLSLASGRRPNSEKVARVVWSRKPGARVVKNASMPASSSPSSSPWS